MPLSFPRSTRPVLWRFAAFVAAPAILLAAALVLFGVWSLWITARQVDHSIRERQTSDVHRALGEALDDLAQSQAGVAIWDPAYAEIGKPHPDYRWLDQNVGIWLSYVFNHEVDIIVDGADRPRYVVRNGVRVDDGLFAKMRPDLTPLIRAARGLDRPPANPHERLPRQPLAAGNTVRTSPAAVHATDLVAISGRAAAVSVMRMIPDSKIPRGDPAAQPMLISIRFLDGGLMRDLQRIPGISEARVTRLPVAADTPRNRLHSIPLRSFGGAQVGYFSWRPEMPGSEMLRSIAIRGGAALAALIGLLAILVFFVGRLLFRDARSIADLEAARVELQAKEAQAQYLANHDVLTGLPNRAAFNRASPQALYAEQRFSGHNVNIGVRQRREGTGRGFRG